MNRPDFSRSKLRNVPHAIGLWLEDKISVEKSFLIMAIEQNCHYDFTNDIQKLKTDCYQFILKFEILITPTERYELQRYITLSIQELEGTLKLEAECRHIEQEVVGCVL